MDEKTAVDNKRFQKFQKLFDPDILTNKILCSLIATPFQMTL